MGWTRFRDITELRWANVPLRGVKLDWLNRQVFRSQALKRARCNDRIDVVAVPVKHWGARMQRDDYRGYNGYLIERNNRRILFAGDTAFTDTFAGLRRSADRPGHFRHRCIQPLDPIPLPSEAGH